MKAIVYKTSAARRPWQHRRKMESRMSIRPFSGNPYYHSRSSLRRDRRKKHR